MVLWPVEGQRGAIENGGQGGFHSPQLPHVRRGRIIASFGRAGGLPRYGVGSRFVTVLHTRSEPTTRRYAFPPFTSSTAAREPPCNLDLVVSYLVYAPQEDRNHTKS